MKENTTATNSLVFVVCAAQAMKTRLNGSLDSGLLWRCFSIKSWV